MDAEGLVVAVVAPAWAVDVNGESVPTGYQIEGTTLVRVIDHHGAAYPVVGVPCWKCWGAAIGGLPLRTVAVASGFACSLSGGRGN